MVSEHPLTELGKEVVGLADRGEDADALVPDPLTLAQDIVDCATDRNAAELMLLDIHRTSAVADYFVICSGNSERQLKAIVRAIVDGVREKWREKPIRTEGMESGFSGWLLLDYGSVVVHVFSPEARDYYRLERLWTDATTLLHMP
ncbi:MAG: ribosome silencing factor [Dehalococcoidia bacterium]|nr:ribosome silencing factor [Dehalococcoidia bacterium]